MTSGPPSTQASAPGKLILCGEHAVVYGRAAIALPLRDVRASADIMTGRRSIDAPPRFSAPDLDDAWSLPERPDHPLSLLLHETLRRVGSPPDRLNGCEIVLSSDIPIAAGLGSGAAVATALVRAVAAHTGRALPPDVVAALVYQCEQHYHGTPSGIDNTVVAFEQAIWFERGTGRDFDNPDHAPTTAMEELHQLASFVRKPAANLVEPVELGEPLTLVIGDTGKRSETHLPVGEVRRRWQAAQQEYEYLFNRVDYIVRQARVALASGDLTSLGILLNENQEALEEMGVSSPELEHLIAAALAAGAWGAKLSGGGWGGVMLALTDEDESAAVAEALRRAGAAHVSITTVE